MKHVLSAVVLCAACQPQASTRWRFSDAPGRVSAPAADRDVVAFGTEDGLVLLTDSGEKRCVLRELGAVAARPIVQASMIWVAAADGRLHALDASCAIRWSSNTIYGRFTSDLLKVDELIYAASTDGYVYALNADSGELRWQFPRARSAPRRPFSQNRLLHHGDRLYVGNRDGQMFSLSLATGELEAEFKSGPLSGGLALGGDELWAATEDGSLFQLQLPDLVLVRRVAVGEPVAAAPLVLKDAVILGTRTRAVVSVSRRSGEVDWRFETRGPIEGDPVLFNRRVIVAGASGDGRVYSVDVQSGEGVARFSTGSRIGTTPFVHDETLLLTSENGLLYAFSDLDDAR